MFTWTPCTPETIVCSTGCLSVHVQDNVFMLGRLFIIYAFLKLLLSKLLLYEYFHPMTLGYSYCFS